MCVCVSASHAQVLRTTYFFSAVRFPHKPFKLFHPGSLFPHDPLKEGLKRVRHFAGALIGGHCGGCRPHTAYFLCVYNLRGFRVNLSVILQDLNGISMIVKKWFKRFNPKRYLKFLRHILWVREIKCNWQSKNTKNNY